MSRRTNLITPLPRRGRRDNRSDSDSVHMGPGRRGMPTGRLAKKPPSPDGSSSTHGPAPPPASGGAPDSSGSTGSSEGSTTTTQYQSNTKPVSTRKVTITMLVDGQTCQTALTPRTVSDEVVRITERTVKTNLPGHYAAKWVPRCVENTAAGGYTKGSQRTGCHNCLAQSQAFGVAGTLRSYYPYSHQELFDLLKSRSYYPLVYTINAHVNSSGRNVSDRSGNSRAIHRPYLAKKLEIPTPVKFSRGLLARVKCGLGVSGY
jgi:hypothetical protein